LKQSKRFYLLKLLAGPFLLVVGLLAYLAYQHYRDGDPDRIAHDVAENLKKKNWEAIYDLGSPGEIQRMGITKAQYIAFSRELSSALPPHNAPTKLKKYKKDALGLHQYHFEAPDWPIMHDKYLGYEQIAIQVVKDIDGYRALIGFLPFQISYRRPDAKQSHVAIYRAMTRAEIDEIKIILFRQRFDRKKLGDYIAGRGKYEDAVKNY
jgi:hypothetical protein